MVLAKFLVVDLCLVTLTEQSISFLPYFDHIQKNGIDKLRSSITRSKRQLLTTECVMKRGKAAKDLIYFTSFTEEIVSISARISFAFARIRHSGRTIVACAHYPPCKIYRRWCSTIRRILSRNSIAPQRGEANRVCAVRSLRWKNERRTVNVERARRKISEING